MKTKNYIKALFTNAVFYAGFVMGLLLLSAYAVCEGFGYIDKFVEASTAIVVLVDVLFAVALIAFIISAFSKFKSQTVSFSDAFIGFLIATAIGGIYLIIAVEKHVVSSALTTVVAIVLAVVLAYIRNKYFDHKYDAIKANATAKTYYKTFFKTYGVISIIFAIVACVGMILLERANVVGHILTANSLKVVAIVGLAGLFVLFCILYFTRIRSKEIGIVDVALFMAIGAILGLIPVIFMVGKTFRIVAIIIEIVLLVVDVLLIVGVIKNTHVYTDEDNMEIENAKTGVASYLKALIDKTNLVTAFGISAILAGVATYLEGINGFGILLQALNLKNSMVINVSVFALIAIFALFVFADVRDYRITAIDSALSVWNITFIFLTILHFALFGGTFNVHFYMVAIGLVIGLVLFLVRSAFVHYGEVTCKVVTVEPATEQPVEEVVETATEETVAEQVVEETVATEAVAEQVIEEVPEQVVEEVVEEAPIKLKRVNAKKIFENYVRTGDDQLKANYSALKNAFYSYGVHSRLTKTRENFSKKGISMSKKNPEKAQHLQAILQVRGKFVKLLINLDPTKLDAKYFRHKDVSAKNPDQATLIKIRSKLTLKRAIELIDMLAVQEGYTKKKKFEPVDYVSQYTDENLTYMEKLGFDYMIKDSVTLDEVKCYNDEFAKKVVKTEIIAKPERYIYDEITLDAICDNFADGEVADLEAMRVKGLIKINSNCVTVKASEKLSKKLTVKANVIETNAIAMIAIAGGEATQLIEN